MSSSSYSLNDNSESERDALVAELQFLGQMSSTETALFHHAAADKNNMIITDSKTISTILQEGPMTAGQIADRLKLTTGAVTSVIDRLERAGYAVRVSDPNDRRKVIVHVREKNVQKLGNVYESMGNSFDELLSSYTIPQLQFLVNHYKASLEITKDEIARLNK